MNSIHDNQSIADSPLSSPTNVNTQSDGYFGAAIAQNEELHPEELENLRLDINRPNLRSVFPKSEPHTPTEQIPPQLGGGLEDFRSKNRFGSVSSIATTDDDDGGVNEIIYPWTEQQDELVKGIYEDVVSKPSMTPFSGLTPPSGILHRVAKDTIRMARHRNVYFPHSMDAVRHRVIYMCHGYSEPTEKYDENYVIPQDYFLPNADEDFDFLDVYSSSARRQSVEEKYGYRQGGPSGLAAPFREPVQPPQLTEEEIVNIVAKRKRDSLRIKRGPQ